MITVNSEIDKDDKCLICDTNNNSKNLECNICRRSLCIECCFKLLSKKTSIITFDDIYIKYNCPFCRNNSEIYIEKFNKEELLKIYKNNLKSYVKVIDDYTIIIKKNKELEYNLNNLKSINTKNENQIDKLSNSLKEVIEVNKSNIKTYNLIIDKYKSIY